MKALFTLLVLITGVMVSSCQEENPEPFQTLDSVNKAIIGEWRWEETIIVNRGQEQIVKTPESEGKMITYTFNEEGKMTIHENGIIIQDSDYEIVLSAASSIQNGREFRLNISNPVGSLNLIISKNKLDLFNGLGTSSIFVKK